MYIASPFACFYFGKDKEESSPNYEIKSGLSVKDFGAKGDGKTNDSPAIQEAVRNLEKKVEEPYIFLRVIIL